MNTQATRAEIIQLYHTARIALGSPTIHERRIYAKNELLKKYPCDSPKATWLAVIEATSHGS